MSAGEITDVIHAEFGISQPAVSQHLRVLRENGFATSRAGVLAALRRRAAPLREVDEWLDRFRTMWDQPMDALGTELARGRRDRRRAGAEPDEKPIERSNDDQGAT